jgi:hypothetical protein
MTKPDCILKLWIVGLHQTYLSAETRYGRSTIRTSTDVGVFLYAEEPVMEILLILAIICFVLAALERWIPIPFPFLAVGLALFAGAFLVKTL